MLNLKSLAILGTLAATLFASAASAETVTFNGAAEKDARGAAAFDVAGNWSTGKLPAASDDVVVRSVMIVRGKAVHTVASLVAGSDVYVVSGASLTVSGDVANQSMIESQDSTFTWTGKMTIGNPPRERATSLSYAHDGRKPLKQSGLVGKDLALLEKSNLQLKIFNAIPEGFAGGSVPVIKLSGALSFGGSNKLIVTVNDSAKAGLPAGEYLIAEAASIEGTLPAIELKQPADAAELAASLRADGGKLILTLAAK